MENQNEIPKPREIHAAKNIQTRRKTPSRAGHGEQSNSRTTITSDSLIVWKIGTTIVGLVNIVVAILWIIDDVLGAIVQNNLGTFSVIKGILIGFKVFPWLCFMAICVYLIFAAWKQSCFTHLVFIIVVIILVAIQTIFFGLGISNANDPTSVYSSTPLRIWRIIFSSIYLVISIISIIWVTLALLCGGAGPCEVDWNAA